MRAPNFYLCGDGRLDFERGTRGGEAWLSIGCGSCHSDSPFESCLWYSMGHPSKGLHQGRKVGGGCFLGKSGDSQFDCSFIC